MKFVLVLILSVIVFSSFAQENTEKEDWMPIFDCNLPMRFFSVKMDGLFEYSIKSTSDIKEIGNGEAEISGIEWVQSTLNFQF